MIIVPQDEVAHTLTESRVLQTTKHPFLTVSSLNFYIVYRNQSMIQNYAFLLLTLEILSRGQSYKVLHLLLFCLYPLDK